MKFRSLGSLQKEYDTLKKLVPELKKMSMSHAAFSEDYKNVSMAIYNLIQREEYLRKVIEKQKTTKNLSMLVPEYAALEASNNTFANFSREDRKKVEYAFENPKDPKYIRDALWRDTYKAFLATENLKADVELHKLANTREKLEIRKRDERNTKKKLEQEIKKLKDKHPNVDFKKFPKQFREMKEIVEGWESQAKWLKSRYETAIYDRKFVNRDVETYDSLTQYWEKQQVTLKEQMDIAKEVIDLIENNQEKMSTLETERHTTRKKYRELDKLQNKNSAEYKQYSKELGTRIKELKDLSQKRGMSWEFSQCIELKQRKIAMGMLNNLIKERQAESPKHLHKTKIKDFYDYAPFRKALESLPHYDQFQLDVIGNFNIAKFEKMIEAKTKAIHEQEKKWEYELSEEEYEMIDDISSRCEVCNILTSRALDGYLSNVFAYDAAKKEYFEKEEQYRELTQNIISKIDKHDDLRALRTSYDEIGVKNLQRFKNFYAKKDEWTAEAKDKYEKYSKQSAEAHKKLEELKARDDKIIEQYEKGIAVYPQNKETLNKLKQISRDLGPVKDLVDSYKRDVDRVKDSMKEELEGKQSVVKSINDNAKNLYDKRSVRQFLHINSAEYDAMIKALNVVMTWPQGGKDAAKFSTMDDVLKNLEDKANKYLIAKDAQDRPHPTDRRIYRLDYAESLVRFATDNMESIKSEKFENCIQYQQMHDLQLQENEINSIDNEAMNDNIREMDEIESFDRVY